MNLTSGTSLTDSGALASAVGVLSNCPPDLEEPTLNPISGVGKDFEVWSFESRVCGGTLPASGLLARPTHGIGPFPLVIAIHGTAASPELLFGLESPAAFDNREYHHQLALKLLSEGYAVFAPRIVTDRELDPGSGFNRTRNRIDRRARSIGLTLIGLELTAVEAAVTQIVALDWIDGARIGSYGISLGGSLAMYHSALDPRVDAVVVSQWFEDRREKMLGRDHPDALWQSESADYAILPVLPEFDDVTVAGLIAPRALFIEAGRLDTERTQRALKVWPALEQVFADAPEHSVCLEVTPGGHEVWFDSSQLFLAYWLTSHHGGLEDPCPTPD